MHTQAVVFDSPGQLARRRLALVAAGEGDAVVDVEWTGISTGTERLLWTGTMPAFPGLGYPLDVEALLIVELDGPSAEVDYLIDRVGWIAKDCQASSLRISTSEEERLAFWAGRKAAFPVSPVQTTAAR